MIRPNKGAAKKSSDAVLFPELMPIRIQAHSLLHGEDRATIHRADKEQSWADPWRRQQEPQHP